MIEPTDEMVDALFERACGGEFESHEDLLHGLAAVFAVVERDYCVSRRPVLTRMISNPCLCGADLGPPWDSMPHQRGTPGCRERAS